ncbi:MAG TPA: fumarylacetoacetate hydrolase family protein [Burkholderiales bacterium]|nr:fumarylacetoacetate hydrolase family protein [Burkholderiales bacterium]
MRLAMYKPARNVASDWRIGAAVDGLMLDLQAAAGAYALERSATRVDVPANILELLRGGDEAMDAVRRVHAWAVAHRATGNGAVLFRSLDECLLDAPLRPGKLITLARNYHEHVAEHGLKHTGKVPSASIKASSSLTGPYDDITKPAVEGELDYETELAFVIGRRCKNVPQARAYEVIAGYTVLCDIVARQVLKIERAAGNQFLGKMFDSFGPLGPWLVTADEVADPMNLTITTRVNGEVRQHSNTGKMIWNIPQLVAYFSQATLEPGDIISTGTPAGVAAGRKPHETPWYLHPGDVIECEVERVGVLRSRIVEDNAKASSWDWVA